jgi:hypothetical protein
VRTVFFALVFVNFAYFAWARWVDAPHPPPVNENISRLPRLKLASEAPSGQPPAATPEKTSFGHSAGCLSVGPFADVDNAARAAAVLRARGFDPIQRAEASAPATVYQVLAGTLIGDAAGSRTVKELQRIGFKDAVTERGSAAAEVRVSLGTFTERGRAEQRLRAAKLKGFKVEVAEQKRPGTQYWMDLKPPAGTGTVPIQDLFAEAIGSRIAVQPCSISSAPTITTAKDPLTPTPAPATAAIDKVP